MKFELNEVEQNKAKDFIDMCNMVKSYRAPILNDKRPLHFEYIFSWGWWYWTMLCYRM